MKKTDLVGLFDLDGVIRLWPPLSFDHELELKFGAARGTMASIALAGDLLRRVTDGTITKVQWRRLVHDLVENRTLVEKWFDRPTSIDWAVVETLQGYRSIGVKIYLLSNGTDELERELSQLDLTRCVDGIFNSWRLRCRKPEIAVFEKVLRALAIAPSRLFFVDDAIENVLVARSVGIVGHAYQDLYSMQAFVDDFLKVYGNHGTD